MKRQRVNTEPNTSYGYGYSSYGDPTQAAVPAASEYAVNPSGVNPQPMPPPGRPQDASLSHGMQPNMQPNMQPGMAGTQQGSGAYNGVPANMNGVNMGNQYGMAGVGSAGQLGQGLGTGTTPNMSQNPGNSIGPQMGYNAMPDMGANMQYGIGSGMGQMQNMASSMSMAPNMGGSQMEAQAGLAPAVGQGMGISEGFPCVKLRGLPFDANEQDVAVWLVCLGRLWWISMHSCTGMRTSMPPRLVYLSLRAHDVHLPALIAAASAGVRFVWDDA